MDGGEDNESEASSVPTFHTRYSDDEATSKAVVRSLAAIEGVAPGAIPPLYESIDPDALDELFDPPGPGAGRELVVTFTAADHRVTVRNDGTITIEDANEAE